MRFSTRADARRRDARAPERPQGWRNRRFSEKADALADAARKGYAALVQEAARRGSDLKTK